VEANNRQKKVFNFFGGEPLIHKDIILDFVRKNEKELQENARGDFNTVVGIVTNGLLLTEELIDEFLAYDFTYILISLDTDRSEVDHREIGQDKINKLMEHIRYMPDAPKQEKRVTIRCTLARENAPFFTEFADNLYNRGIRRMVVHPLVLDSSKGFIRWKDEEWSKLHQDILDILDKYSDMQIHFSEGVGQKGEENCMIGSDMIAIDASGDFSGCYFFTNQKANTTSDTILGNLFHRNIYIDRYKTFQKEYAKMFEMEEQCQKCDYKNACYQCPAGNLDTGVRMFRPDDMCQKIVKLYIDLQEDISKKQFKKKYEIICSAMGVEGENITFAKAISYMMFYFHFNYHPKLEVVHDGIYEIDDYRKMLAVWKNILNGNNTVDFTTGDFVSQIKDAMTDEIVEIGDFYYHVLQRGNLAPINRRAEGKTEHQRAFFLSLLHMIILQSMHKTYEGTFSERLVAS
jgi:radical SAM protein with 4Fe4S-binding SPASM domain